MRKYGGGPGGPRGRYGCAADRYLRVVLSVAFKILRELPAEEHNVVEKDIPA